MVRRISMTYRCLMLGAGSMGARWMRDIWAPFRAQGRMEFAGLVDTDPARLAELSDWLDLPETARFTNAREAFAAVEADFCCIVTPPDWHREAVELACARGMDILTEKPIADTPEGCAAIARAVRAAGVKMLVTQNYRYTRRILTLKAAVASLGTVNYAVARYASDYRRRGAWAEFRHRMRHGLLIEGSIHHFDQLRNLTGANGAAIAGWDWNPGQVRGATRLWRGSESFDAEACALFSLRMTDGSFASYEGNNLAAGKTNSWYGESYRVECEGGAAVLDRDNTVRIEVRSAAGTFQTREVAPVAAEWESHQAIAAQFLDWLDGGAEPATTLEDNLHSMALLFGAVRAAEMGTAVDVQEVAREVGAFA
jgi:predicted dehydrogenase